LKVFGAQQPSTFKCSYKAVEPHKALVESCMLHVESFWRVATFKVRDKAVELHKALVVSCMLQVESFWRVATFNF
jgi:hypothetical protein